MLEQNGRLTAVDVGQASRNGDAAANAIIQRAGSLIGQMLASIVNFFNPSHVFIGGGVTQIGPLFLASVRQSVYHRSLALVDAAPGHPVHAAWRTGRRGRRGRAGDAGIPATPWSKGMSLAVEFRDVVKNFGPVQVLHGVSFSIAPGRVLA